MKFKENFKRFMTLDRHHDGGFTLVELIVVIAILAILAGIGVPAYSSYIGKANLAADQQVIDIVNTCFAAAAADSWMSVAELQNSELVIENGEVTGLVAKNAGDKKAEIEAAFLTYFKGGSLKTVSSVAPSGPRGFSIGGSNGGSNGTTSGGKFTDLFNANADKNANAVTKFQGSTFNDMGSKELMNRVDEVTGLVSDLMGTGKGTDLKILLGETYFTDLAERMGMTPEELGEHIANQGDTDAQNQYFNDLLANYAVLQVADNASGKTTAQMLNDLKSGVTSEQLQNLLASTDAGESTDAMGTAAAMYAMYTAYANTLTGDAKAEAEANLASIGAFAGNLSTITAEGSGFMNYLNNVDANGNPIAGSNQAESDMAGYLGALEIISNSAGAKDENGNYENTDTIRDLLEGGYANDELLSALQGLLGN